MKSNHALSLGISRRSAHHPDVVSVSGRGGLEERPKTIQSCKQFPSPHSPPERAKKVPWAGTGRLGLSTRTGPKVREGPFGGWARLSLRTASKAHHSWREASGSGPSANLPFGHLGRRGAPCTHCLSVLERDSSWRRIQPEVRTEPSDEKGRAEPASLAHSVNPGPYWLNKCKASTALAPGCNNHLHDPISPTSD